MDLTLLGIAGILSGVVAELPQLRHIVESGQKPWVEWSAWAILVVCSWKERIPKAISTSAEKENDLRIEAAESESQNGRGSVTVLAGFFWLSQLLWVSAGESIWWSTPAVSLAVFTFYYSLGYSEGLQKLARFCLRPNCIPSFSKWKSYKIPILPFHGLMIAAPAFLFFSNAAAGTQSLPTGALYVVLQTLTFILLSQHMAPYYEVNQNDHVFLPPLLSHLSKHAFLVWTLYNIFIPVQGFKLQLSTIALGLLRSIQLYSVIVLSIKDALLAPATLSTASLIIAACTEEATLVYRFLASILAYGMVMQLISILADFTSRRKWLFLIISVFVIVTIGSVNLTDVRGRLVSSITYTQTHPIEELVQKAQTQFKLMEESQSKTLDESVSTYIKRYGRNPPPGFDKWFEIAQKEGYVLVDEFDTIMESLEPFWGVAPSILRKRTESVSNALLMVRVGIKDHQIDDYISHEKIWQAETIDGWLEKHRWLDILPDMAFSINLYDEPRVVAPLDTVLAAKEKARSRSPTPRWPQSGHLQDLPKDLTGVAWLELGKREAWQAMLSSCSIDSPARDETPVTMDESPLCLPFVNNLTKSKDVCQIADLHRFQGFFISPSSCHITHSLVPVFSPSKPSIFNDILYPSIWYWIKMSVNDYKEEDDLDWSAKKDNLYWTGSATGGFANMQNWQDLHRQRLVMKVANNSTAPVTLLQRESGSGIWQPYKTQWRNISHMLDIRLTSVEGQCSEEACKVMHDVFHIIPYNKESDGPDNPNMDLTNVTYASKYVLDLDGNTFSGRFYRLMESKSAVLKQTIFKEWHDGRLVPWVHFIPVSSSAAELGEIMRFLIEEEAGRQIGRDIAAQGRHWTKRTLRMIDLEVTFLRILMEYGRIVSDDRDSLGYFHSRSTRS